MLKTPFTLCSLNKTYRDYFIAYFLKKIICCHTMKHLIFFILVVFSYYYSAY